MRKNWVFLGLGLLVAVLAIAVACNDDGEADEAQLEQDVCADLAELETALINLDTTLRTDGVTVGEAQDAKEQVKSALENVKDSGQDLAEARYESVEAATETLDQAIDEIPDDTSLQQASVSVLGELAGVVQAEQAFAAEVGCVAIPEATP